MDGTDEFDWWRRLLVAELGADLIGVEVWNATNQRSSFPTGLQPAGKKWNTLIEVRWKWITFQRLMVIIKYANFNRTRHKKRLKRKKKWLLLLLLLLASIFTTVNIQWRRRRWGRRRRRRRRRWIFNATFYGPRWALVVPPYLSLSPLFSSFW